MSVNMKDLGTRVNTIKKKERRGVLRSRERKSGHRLNIRDTERVPTEGTDSL